MAIFNMIYVAFLFWATLVVADRIHPTQKPSTLPILGRSTSQGCFGLLSLSATLSHGDQRFVSSGMCWNRCRQEGKHVMITHLTRCYCADTYPARVSQLDDDQCDYPCPGYPMEACGSLNGAFSVFNTGLKVAVENDDDKPTSSSITSTSTTTANAGSPTSETCHSALTGINDIAQEVSAAARRVLSKIRVFFDQCIGRLESDATKQSSEETEGVDL